MSTFNDADIFGSGPHRFAQLTLGEYLLVNARVDPFQPGSTAVGPLELSITVRGRLVASSEEDLWSQRDAISALVTHPPTVAALKEDSGREWNDMNFVAFTPADRTDRGRTFSLAYTATFVRLAS
jgi:hypothetical protein